MRCICLCARTYDIWDHMDLTRYGFIKSLKCRAYTGRIKFCFARDVFVYRGFHGNLCRLWLKAEEAAGLGSWRTPCFGSVPSSVQSDTSAVAKIVVCTYIYINVSYVHAHMYIYIQRYVCVHIYIYIYKPGSLLCWRLDAWMDPELHSLALRPREDEGSLPVSLAMPTVGASIITNNRLFL